MQNPYEVLELREGASQEEIKAAYKTLVKKYHPDKYQNNPLADLAEEKLQEINEAYDYLMKNQGQSYHSAQAHTAGAEGPGHVSPEFMEIRRYIDKGNLAMAEQRLNNASVQNAEWYFLSGMLSYRKGWYDDALGKMQTAVSMDPNNIEYKRNLNTIMGSGSMYRNTAYNRGYASTDDMLCRMCQCYLCTDMLCDCI